MRRTANTKGRLKNDMELLLWKLLKHIHTSKGFKWSRHTMGQTIPQLDNLCYKTKWTPWFLCAFCFVLVFPVVVVV